MAKKPVLLCIMDGFGWVPEQTFGNAIAAAKRPNLDRLFETYPYTTIQASGMAVGLPEGQMGNSEVGHTNMGAGRIVYQQLTLITKSIMDGTMKENDVLVRNMRAAIDAGKAVHLMGLLGTGGVHSHIDHLFGLLDLAKHLGAKKIYVHCIMDGRDTDPHSGRYYAMDRDSNWDREEKAYAALVYGEGNHASNAMEAIEKSYADDVTDEFVVPCVIKGGAPVASGDSVVFFNFRPDRAREITRTFVDPDFTGFTRKNGFFPLTYVCMTQYDATMPNVEIAFKPQSLKNTLGEYVSDKGLKQLRIAETEKYAHVTFFFNGGVEKQYPGEDRILVKSPKVATYDLQPEMSAYEVTDKMVEAVKSGKYDMIILNFANCDMVGHTGVFEAAKAAVEAVDTCVGKVAAAIDEMGGVLLITAHTTNPVPFCVVGYPCKLREGGVLADIAPTMLKIMDLPQPEEMTGKSIIL